MEPTPKQTRRRLAAAALAAALCALAHGCGEGGGAGASRVPAVEASAYDGVVRDERGAAVWTCIALPPRAQATQRLQPVGEGGHLGVVCITGEPLLTFGDAGSAATAQPGGAPQAVRALATALGQQSPDQLLDDAVLVAAGRRVRYEEVRSFLRECTEYGIGIWKVLLLVLDDDGRQCVVRGFLPNGPDERAAPAARATVDEIAEDGAARVRWEAEPPARARDLGAFLASKADDGEWIEVALDGKLEWGEAVHLMDQALDLDRGVELTLDGFRVPSPR